MLRDITLGQYYQTESLIHKMDPRVKLGGTVLFIISLFFFKNYAGYVIAALFLGLVIRLSKVPFKFMVKGMKTIVMLMLITVVFNLFLTPGTPLFTIWKLTITQEGLKMAISMAIRLTANHWILCDDADYHTEQSDGRYGENDGTLKSIQGART